MSWSYDPARLAAVPMFRVRLELGDTDPSDRLFQDEELSAALAEAGASVLGASALMAERAAAKYARQATMSTGQVSVQYGERARLWRDVADRLRRRGAVGAAPYIGGASLADMDRFQQDDDQVQPRFTPALHEEPGAAEVRDELRRGGA